MASVVQGTDGTYDLARGLRLYDTDGDLPGRSRELWGHIQHAGIDMARDFWRRYANSTNPSGPSKRTNMSTAL